MYSEEEMIDFANWLRREDTQVNAEKYFGYSDKDMLKEWKSAKKINKNS